MSFKNQLYLKRYKTRKRRINIEGENLAVYEALRNSIVSCEERIANETIYMYVIYFAMLSFGFQYNWLFLVTFVVLIVFQAMINTDKLAIEKASTYIRVFFEEVRDDMHWETMHKDSSHLDAYKKKIRNIGWYLNKYGSSCLAIISFIALIVTLIQQHDYIICKLSASQIIMVVIAVILCGVAVRVNKQVYINNGESNDSVSKSIEKFHKNK